MTALDKRPHQTTEFFGKPPPPLVLEDSVRLRDRQTHTFRDDIIVVIVTDEMTVQFDGSLMPVVVSLKSVKHHGEDGDYADGSSGSDGGSSNALLRLTETGK